MKLSALGPFTATPAPEEDPSLEAQKIERKGQQTRPVSGDEASPSPRDSTDEEARQGFVRLADFLKQQKKKKDQTGNSLKKKALAAYRALDEMEDAALKKGAFCKYVI